MIIYIVYAWWYYYDENPLNREPKTYNFIFNKNKKERKRRRKLHPIITMYDIN